jgi:hypothetical protein
MNVANGLRLSKRNIRAAIPAAVMLATAAAVGLLGVKLWLVLVVMLPLSLLLARPA